MKTVTLKGRAGVEALLDWHNSEFYALWPVVIVRLVSHYLPALMAGIDRVAGVISDGQMSGQVMLTCMLGYAALRVVSKVAKR